MDFVNLFIINKLSSKNGSENSVCKRIFGLLNGLHGSLVNATHRIYAISACNASSSALVRA